MNENQDDIYRIYDVKLFNINDFNILLHEILKQTRSILSTEAGSIYINEGDSLSFNVFQNDAMSYENVYKQYYLLKDVSLPLHDDEKYLAVESFKKNKVIIIDDVYESKYKNFDGVKEFDKRFDYRTHSIITIPIIHPIENKKLGVVQLLNKKIDENYEVFNEKDKETLLMASSFIALSISKAQNDIEKLKDVNKKLQDANEELKKRVKEEIEISEIKSKIIFQQSKLISLGEMVGNIAHQWRQPLSAISTIASTMSFNIELNDINKKDLLSNLDNIVDTTQHLSQTIDDFRNFYKIDKVKKLFNFANSILKAISIIKPSLIENRIQLITNLDNEIEFYAYENELKQAILNILQNAKDVIIENKESQNRFIFINLKKEDKEIILSIKDNGNGVPLDFKDKIFDQNFTTKAEDEGTGIGLYMTKEIIEKNMNGKISIKNEEYEYDNKKYKGANFIIRFNTQE